MVTVTYRGFLATVVRHFPSRSRAEQWVRQVGQWRNPTLTIEEE